MEYACNPAVNEPLLGRLIQEDPSLESPSPKDFVAHQNINSSYHDAQLGLITAIGQLLMIFLPELNNVVLTSRQKKVRDHAASVLSNILSASFRMVRRPHLLIEMPSFCSLRSGPSGEIVKEGSFELEADLQSVLSPALRVGMDLISKSVASVSSTVRPHELTLQLVLRGLFHLEDQLEPISEASSPLLFETRTQIYEIVHRSLLLVGPYALQYNGQPAEQNKADSGASMELDRPKESGFIRIVILRVFDHIRRLTESKPTLSQDPRSRHRLSNLFSILSIIFGPENSALVSQDADPRPLYLLNNEVDLLPILVGEDTGLIIPIVDYFSKLIDDPNCNPTNFSTVNDFILLLGSSPVCSEALINGGILSNLIQSTLNFFHGRISIESKPDDPDHGWRLWSTTLNLLGRLSRSTLEYPHARKTIFQATKAIWRHIMEAVRSSSRVAIGKRLTEESAVELGRIARIMDSLLSVGEEENGVRTVYDPIRQEGHHELLAGFTPMVPIAFAHLEESLRYRPGPLPVRELQVEIGMAQILRSVFLGLCHYCGAVEFLKTEGRGEFTRLPPLVLFMDRVPDRSIGLTFQEALNGLGILFNTLSLFHPPESSLDDADDDGEGSGEDGWVPVNTIMVAVASVALLLGTQYAVTLTSLESQAASATAEQLRITVGARLCHVLQDLEKALTNDVEYRGFIILIKEFVLVRLQ